MTATSQPSMSGSDRRRARNLGIAIGQLAPGPWNAITDVPGVRVGHTTLIAGDGPLVVGEGPVRTGVTVVLPGESIRAQPLFAGYHVLNGCGEMTGLVWIAESGLLTSAIGLTNTYSVGVVHDALISCGASWGLPVVAETWDGQLSDIRGMHVHPEHVRAALDSASGGPVAEGCVGGGTGMICHGFKGGIGTASRALPAHAGGWTVGVLVQANHGQRRLLRVNGVPVGQEITVQEIPDPFDPSSSFPAGTGSIIVIVATDAPLLPHQCRRLAQRATIGVGRAGGLGENSSGDIMLAFSTASTGASLQRGTTEPASVRMLPNHALDPLFEAVADSTEEAILNALCAATTTTGIAGRTAYALPLDRLDAVMRRYGRRDE
jgi:D-aminopeptidase